MNHYIEVDKDENDQYYLVVHSGSRYLGKQIAEHYQKLAVKELSTESKACEEMKTKMIEELKAKGESKRIQKELNRINESFKFKGDQNLAYLYGESLEDYLHDMKIAQEYAFWNRKAIITEIIKHMQGRIEAINSDSLMAFDTIHNYIDMQHNILRKGSVSAQEGEWLIIPMNMKDGSLICVGKGNADWNYSAPHGAGRLMSRSKAKENINMNDFKESMKGIESASILQSTLDEAPQAYKPMEEIKENIKDTVDIIKQIKPIFNFKAH